MAIIGVTEDPWELDAEESLQDGITGVRVFNVYSDRMDEDFGTVLAACPVSLGSLFPGSLTAQCVSRKPKRASRDDFSKFTVTCNYKSILNQTEQSRIDHPNPLDREAKVTWNSRTVMEAKNRLQMATAASGLEKAYKLFSSSFTFRLFNGLASSQRM